ncbi:hypothetical protein BCR34DRAFT_134628 [Clohesyomyces aquaticus]|uniref:Uncharacterized protein n=1 Tax=Clohesyomyces aquaticus TaxID=1231657 RepID=A0A1Y2AAJ8_9PLEO|nr:hypothetical protein BCR34DRAFT_134628 [Clohesyomyces aquaticus]
MGSFNLEGAQAASVPIAIIRFAIFIPFGGYFGYAIQHWNLIKRHVELQGAPYNPIIAKAQEISHHWGKVGFYWNFAVWIPAIVIPAPLSLIFTIVDLAITVMLAIATHFQTGYVPHSFDGCRGNKSHEFQLPPNTNESFFEIAARLNSTSIRKTSPFAMCKSYVEEWQYGLSVTIFYALIVFINIIVSFNLFREHRRKGNSFKQWLSELTVAFPQFLAIFVYVPWFLLVLIFRCLPLSLKSRTRFGRRYAVKTAQRLPTPHEVKMKTMSMTRRDGKKRYKGGEDGNPTGLAEFLGIYDVLMLVVEDLHYADIVNLSLASKSVREAVLPAADYDRRIKHFRMYACEPETKSQCWVCANTICQLCLIPRSLRPNTLTWHLDTCHPYCTSCYWSSVAHTRLNSRTAIPRCICAPPTAHPSFLQTLWRSATWYSSRQPAYGVMRNICTECDRLSDAEIAGKREKRTKKELRDPQRDGCEVCWQCKEGLGGGPRWWVCGSCRKECTKACHAPWGKRRKGESREGEGEARGDGAV